MLRLIIGFFKRGGERVKKLILFLICIALLILTLTFTGCSTEEKEVMVFRKNITFDDVMILNQEVE